MMRNTSPVGWLPLLAIKVIQEGSLIPFIISGLFVALPILFGCVWMDTAVYGSEKWVFTGYNFLEMNIIHGLSKYFGEDGPLYYLVAAAPSIFVILVPIALLSTFTHIRNQQALQRTPYISYYTIFYVLFFSLIAHKEIRFLMPVIPFIMICSGEYTAKLL
jgi:phosphatidylinositol glycan class B